MPAMRVFRFYAPLSAAAAFRLRYDGICRHALAFYMLHSAARYSAIA